MSNIPSAMIEGAQKNAVPILKNYVLPFVIGGAVLAGVYALLGKK